MGEGNHIPGNCFQKERDLNILTVDGQNFPLLLFIANMFCRKEFWRNKVFNWLWRMNSLMLPLRIDKGENVQKET